MHSVSIENFAMATGWLKSFQCKTRAFDDVQQPRPNPSPKMIISSSSCRKSVQSIKGIIDSAEMRKRPSPTKKKVSKDEKARSSSGSLASVSNLGDPTRIIRVIPSSSVFLPTLTEVGERHPSRKVVEMIFKSSWSLSPLEKLSMFSGKVEMVFKVQNSTWALTQFEEYRELVKSRSGSGCNENGRGRCSADGNEVLRFHYLGLTAAGNIGLAFPKGKGKWVCTYSGSGRAHERGGCGSGRKGIIVCRVIAGRVGKKGMDTVGNGFGCGFDSVSDSGGEIVT